MKVKSESEVAQLCLTLSNHRLQPTRLFHPWDFPGKSTGVGGHCLLRIREEAERNIPHGSLERRHGVIQTAVSCMALLSIWQEV